MVHGRRIGRALAGAMKDVFLIYLGTWLYLGLAGLVLSLQIALGGLYAIDIFVASASACLFVVLEYLSHRFFLHPCRIFGKVVNRRAVEALHVNHHLRPVTRLYRTDEVARGLAVFAGGILPAAAIFAFFGHVLLAGRGGTAVAVLLLFSAFHEYVHRMAHLRYKSNHKWLNQLCRHHILHHYRDENHNFGMVTTIMDRLFGTFARNTSEMSTSATRFSLGLSSSSPILSHKDRLN